MKTANKKKTITKAQAGTVRRGTVAKSKRSDAEYGILPGDSWLVQVRKIAQSVGGFDLDLPPRRRKEKP